MKISAFKTNSQAEVDGVWVEAGNGLRLLLARFNNRNYQRYVRKAGKGIGRLMKMGQTDVEGAEKLVREAMASTVLLGWENLEDDNGQPIPYSTETALKLLTDFPDFYTMVSELSTDVEHFRAEATEAASKN